MNIQKKFLKKYTSLQKRVTLKKSALIPALTLFLFIFVLFVTTKGLTPHTSELNYIEHSVSKKGSVVPASCDTATPHDGEICGAWIATGACPSWYACGQAASSIPYSCQGANTSPGCYGAQPPNISCPATPACSPTVMLSFSGPPVLPPVSVSVSTSNDFITYGTTPETISWTSTGSSACYIETLSGATVLSGYPQTTTGSWTALPYSGVIDRIRTYRVSCANGTIGSIVSNSVTVTEEGSHIPVVRSGGGGCFVAGTKVTLGDGSTKNIEEITSDEIVMTSGGPKKVLQALKKDFSGNIYAFNGDENYFVTGNHPFMTTEGWKSLNPEETKLESPDLDVSLLSLGDILIREDGSTVVLTDIKKKYTKTNVYNFEIEGTHDYYANKYWVHNKTAINLQ